MGESSEHMASQRFNEELFLRIPRKEFGGDGKFGKAKSLIFTVCNLWSCARDFSKATLHDKHEHIDDFMIFTLLLTATEPPAANDPMDSLWIKELIIADFTH